MIGRPMLARFLLLFLVSPLAIAQGAPVPGLTSRFDHIEYVYLVPEGKYAEKFFVVLGRESEEPFAIKIVDQASLQVEKTIHVCCSWRGKNFFVEEVAVTPQGTIYAYADSAQDSVYRSKDGGKSWTRLGPASDYRSPEVRFMDIGKASYRDVKNRSARGNGYFNSTRIIGVNGKGDLVLENLWSGPGVAVIDHETGEGRFHDFSSNLPHAFNPSFGAWAVKSGDIYLSGKLEDRNEYPTVLIRSRDGGKSFQDVSDGGLLEFQGVSWNGELLMKDPDVEGRYVINGKPAGAKLSSGMSGSPHYYMYVNGMIAHVGGSYIEYSIDSGNSVSSFRTPDRVTIYGKHEHAKGTGNYPYY